MKNQAPCTIAVLFVSTLTLAPPAKSLDGFYSKGCRLEGSLINRGPEYADPNFQPERTFKECEAACERQSKARADPKDPNYCTGFNFINSPTSAQTGLLPPVKPPEGVILPVYACQLLRGTLDYGSAILAPMAKKSYLRMSVDSCIYPCGQPALCAVQNLDYYHPGEIGKPLPEEPTLPK